MDKYKVIFKCEDGYEFNEFIYAKNESMAIEVVKAMGYFEEFHDVVNTTCLLIGDKEWDDNVRDNYDYVGEICPHCNNEVFIHPKWHRLVQSAEK